MKLIVALTALYATTVAGFAPLYTPPTRGTTTPTSIMVSTSQREFESMSSNNIWNGPDLERHVPIPPLYSEASPAYLRGKGDVIVDPDFRWSSALLAMGPAMLMMYPSALGVGASAFHLVLAAFLASQTNRVRLVFGRDGFELFNLANSGEYLKEKPSNYVAGTANRWRYDDIVEYGFYPSIHNPFIVYFKETATSSEQSGRFGWWGQLAKNIYMGDKKAPGQTHFMPALFDVTEFVSQMDTRRGVKASSSSLSRMGNFGTPMAESVVRVAKKSSSARTTPPALAKRTNRKM